VRDLTSLEIRNTLAGEYVPLWFADGNAELLTLSTNSELHLWDLSQTALRHRVDLSRSAGRVSRAVGSQDGRWVAALSRDRPGIWIVASNSGRVETVLDSSFSGDSWLAFSPDARFLAACGGRTIEVWDLQSRRLAARQQPHKDGISSAFFSPDGRLLASTSVDNTVKIWSVKDWREVAMLTGHREGVMRGAFSPDGRTLATGCADGTVKLWHVPTFREIAHFRPLNITWHVAFSPDGRVLACAPGSGPLYLLRSPSVEEIEALRNKGNAFAAQNRP
jgi:WD40 repeat protein